MRGLALVAMCTVLLSGCVKSDATALPEPSFSSVVVPDDGNVTVPILNTPPVATLLVNGTNFTVGLNVTFSVSVVDADNDTVEWALLFGDEGALANATSNGTVGNTTGSATDGNATIEGNTTADAVALSSDLMPATINHTYAIPGNFTARLVVTDGAAWANVTLQVNVSGAAPVTVIFYDGAEAGLAQWTITGMLFVNPNLVGTTGQTQTPAPNPGDPENPNPAGVKWHISTAEAQAGTASWWPDYPDNYRTRMVSTSFEVPAGGATLSYTIKGGAELTGTVEGLFVLAGPAGGTRTQLALHSNVFPEWTVFTFPLAAGPTQLEFRFDSDLSCSNYTGPPPGFGCGAGYDAGGIYVDEITVSA